MEKELKEKLEKFCSKSTLQHLEENDKRVGTSAALALGDVVTITGTDYIDNKRTYESAEAAAADGVMANRIQPDENGKVTIDNSYYAVTTDGVVSSVSLRSLTSWAQLENCPEGALRIPAGKASDVYRRLAEFNGKKLKVVAREEWEENEEHNGRKQRFSGSALAFQVVE